VDSQQDPIVTLDMDQVPLNHLAINMPRLPFLLQISHHSVLKQTPGAGSRSKLTLVATQEHQPTTRGLLPLSHLSLLPLLSAQTLDGRRLLKHLQVPLKSDLRLKLLSHL
jgi:hypothetical protein